MSAGPLTKLKKNLGSATAGYLLIITAAMLWGTTGTSQALAPEGATPLSVGALRLLVGGSALLLVAGIRGELLQNWQHPAILISGLSTALYQLTFFAGVKLTGVAIGTLVTIGSAPILAGVFGAVLRGENLTRRWYVATILSVVGGILLLAPGSSSTSVNPVGVLLALGAGLSYTIFALATKELSGSYPPDAIMAVAFCLGAIMLSPTLFLVPINWVVTLPGLLTIGHLGILATAVSYMLFARGIQRVNVSTAGTLSLMEPLTAALLAIVVLGEPITLMGSAGIVFIVIGLLVLVLRK